MKIKRKVLDAVKICINCKKKIELLRFRCPYCGSEAFSTMPDQELIESMQGYQMLSQQHVDQGARLFKQGFFDQAQKEFLKSIEANPWNATAHGNIGMVLLRKNRPREAIKWFKKALKIDPRVPGGKEMIEEAQNQIHKMSGL
jgi:tetratricopeptide (TPR) repeat protein